MAFTAPLDLETLLVANFAGSAEIFLFAASIFVTFLSAKFRIPNGVAMALYGIFIIIMTGTFLAGTFTGIYVTAVLFAILFMGLVFYKLLP